PLCSGAAEEVARLCEGLGHTVEPVTIALDTEPLRRALWVLFGTSARVNIDLRLGALGRTLADGEVEPATRAWADDARRFGAVDYLRGVQAVHAAGRRLGLVMERHDVLLLPTLADPPLPLGTIDMAEPDARVYFERLFERLPFTPLFNISGQPAIQLPLVWSEDGLPIGVQFAARLGDEATLIRLASQLETARPWADRHPPLFG
ncbi:MAG: amidase family protein, partial [Alphaproteobacteria bacterium]